MGLDKHLIVTATPKADTEQTVTEGNLRVTVLSPCLIRVEKSASRTFTDEATQTVLNRVFPNTAFTKTADPQYLTIKTEKASFKVPFGNEKLHCIPCGTTEYIPCRNKNNLKGTARTLDGVACPIPVADGVLSKDGAAILDDSRSLVFGENGELKHRRAPEYDAYV
ncbi:MAG: DUF4968 domain-containing protein, partial [Clostridiales bacterium]|nr:DUF4968 domain-containing protein [Clostridiales bacterium]